MCGIAGFLGDFGQGLLDEMSSTIAHRGPDDAGVYRNREQGVGLAHRRLSIIDLSPAGHQPMWDVNKRAVIVFNGEIYNYRELRSDLIDSGFPFHSHSDTEVLLNLYLRDGESMLSRLNGIFAFAIWDTRTNALFLARDGLGVKPLYFAQTSKGLLFASELKALLKEPSVDRRIDPSAVVDYLTYLWCPAPHTMLEKIKKLEPGHGMRARGNKVERVWQFYDLPTQTAAEPLSVDQAIKQIQGTLRQAVERQMVADVPVGAFLSGGLDSGAVVAFAREFAGAARMQCFTIGFNGPGVQEEGMTADLPYAQRLAQHLDVDLHTIYVGPEMVNDLEKMIYHLDEPQADPAPLNVLFIGQLARSHGIKVLLSGAGGDDIFTGYRRHYALMQEKYWAWLPKSARSCLARLAEQLPIDKPGLRRFGKAFRYADLDGDERIASYFNWPTPSLVSRLCKPLLKNHNGPHTPSSLVSSLSNIPANTSPLNRMLYLECKHFLADHNLNYTDKMSMASGVEVRVPLLDPDLIELAARLPIHYKQRGRTGKWIFKKAMEPYFAKGCDLSPQDGVRCAVAVLAAQSAQARCGRRLIESLFTTERHFRSGRSSESDKHGSQGKDRWGVHDFFTDVHRAVVSHLPRWSAR